MKKIILFIVLFSTGWFCSIMAQNTYPYPSTGNLGIGTTSPAYTLDVNGTVRLGGFTGNNANETSKLVWYKDTPNGWDEQLLKVSSSYGPWGRPGFAIHMHETKHFGFYSTSWNPLLDIEGGTGRVYIKGNTGIGTTTPGANLVVNGKARIISNLAVGADEDGPAFFPVYIKGQYATIGFNVSNQGADQKIWAAIANGSQFRIITENDAYGVVQEGLVINRSGVNINTVTFPNGNVLIGKTTQTNTNYKLDVNGIVRANKIVINSSGADFVFEPSYALPTLQSVESFIKKYHHLPGIASAVQMQNKGVDIGEHQTNLLQKTEELTLYIIQQNKKIEVLEKQLKEQADLLQKLSEKIQINR